MKQPIPSSQKLVVIWQRFGPYHLARLRAVCEFFKHVVGIEVSATDHYSWRHVESDDPFQRVTLFNDQQYETIRGGQIAEAMRRQLNSIRPDVLAINGWSVPEARAASKWAKAHHCRTVLMSETFVSSGNLFKELLKSKRVKRFDAALVGGTWHAEYLVKLGFPRDKISIGYDAVDNEFFRQGAQKAREQAKKLRAKLRLPEQYFYANTRLLPRKKIDALLKAYAAYRHADPANPWGLVISGSGQSEASLLQLADDLNLTEHVVWPGFVQYEDLPIYYGLASAFVHIADREAWGLVINEAIACGLPVVIGQNVGAACELVTPENGVTVDPEDSSAVTNALREFSTASTETLAKMQQASLRIADRYRVETFGRGLFVAAGNQGPAREPNSSVGDQRVMKILHVIRGLANSSGTTHIVGPLAEAQARLGHEVEVFHVEKMNERSLEPDPDLVKSTMFRMSVRSRHYGYSKPFCRAMKADVMRFEVVHIHAIWNYVTCTAMNVARQAAVPYVVAPQGSLETWALGRNRWAKQVYSSLFEKRLFDAAAAMQALTGREATQIQDFGIRSPVKVLPNGVPIELIDDAGVKDGWRAEIGLGDVDYVVLFLGRIFPKKGIDLLPPAISQILRKRKDIGFAIAGHDAGQGFTQKLKEDFARLGVDDKVKFVGEMVGRDKFQLLKSVDLFMLPSYSEGLPVAVLESLACSTPALVSPHCNIPEVQQRSAGWICEATVDAVCQGLQAALASKAELQRRGANGRRLIEEQFTWQRIAQQSIEIYQNLALANPQSVLSQQVVS